MTPARTSDHYLSCAGAPLQVSGFVGAGGNAGSVITQQIFFKGNLETYNGILWMGVMIIGVTLIVIPIYFPMWCAPTAVWWMLAHVLALPAPPASSCMG